MNKLFNKIYTNMPVNTSQYFKDKWQLILT